MKAPANAKGSGTRSTAAKPAGKAAQPAAKPKQVADSRRSAAPKPATKPAAKPAGKASAPPPKALSVKAAPKPKAASAAAEAPPPPLKTAALKAAPKPAAAASRTATPRPAAAGRAAEAGRTAPPPEAAVAPASPAPKPAARPASAPMPAAKLAPAAKPAPIGLAEQQAAVPLPAPAPPVSAPSAPARREGPHSPPPRQPAKPVEFKAGDHVVYPTHGVGTVQGIETMSAAGHSLQVIVVTFDENRMTLRVPVGKASSSGLRKLASDEAMKEALDTLKGRARIKRTMWSRRAQEYEAKINSGDPIQIAEVVRDLHRNAGQPDQSFSERQIYEQALDRLAAELAAIDRTDKAAAIEKLLQHLKAA
jgi:CarD family transcriptional regulator